MRNDGFRLELFDDPRSFEETPLRDRKANFPNLRRDDEKAEFIRDVIALANTSRMLGESSYLLFGIDDKGEKVGIDPYLHPYREQGSGHAWENIQHKLSEILTHCITPLVNWTFHHGEEGGKSLAYLLIQPMAMEVPFRSAVQIRYRDRQGRDRELVQGKSWIRFGESKEEIDVHVLMPDGDYFRYCYGILPYVLPSFWLRYFEKLPDKHDIASATQVQGYQDLQTNEGRLQDAIEQFLASQQKILVIEGIAGIGKSTLVKRFVVEYCEAGLHEMEVNIANEAFSFPNSWIPIYFPLGHEQFHDGLRLARSLINEANNIGGFWKPRPDVLEERFKPEGLFQVSNLKWVIFLDSVDEILNTDNLHKFVASVREFSRKNPLVKIVLTTRPGLSNIVNTFDPHDRHFLSIRPLSRDDVIQYFASLPADIGGQFDDVPDPFKQLMDLMDQNRDFKLLCSIPVMLEIIAEEWLRLVYRRNWTITESDSHELEIPHLRIGNALYSAYTNLWQREKERRELYRQRYNTWLLNVGRLAIRMDGRRSTRPDEAIALLGGAESVPLLANLGILEADAEQVSFLTDLTKVFFAARHVATYIDQLSPEETQWFNQAALEFQNDVLEMAIQLSSDEQEIRQLADS